jgi:hypothetical protein
MSDQTIPPANLEEIHAPITCANHPDVETSLRCNRCEKPICTRCAVLTPTGYRCKECVRGQQKLFETTEWYDYPLAILLAGGLAFLGSLIIPRLGFFALFLAPVAGTLIAEVIRFATRRRRSLRLFMLTAGAAAVGSLPLLVLGLIGLVLGGGSAGGLFSLLWQGLYTLAVTSTVYYRLSGIQIRR